MKKWKAPTAVLATAALTMGLLTVGATSAFAATICNSDLGDAVVVGDLTVGAGANCVLGGAHVQGNVIVSAGGWLDATSTVIDGSVTGTDAYGISIDGDSVGGNIIAYSVDGGFLYLNDLEVTGNVELGGVDVEINDSAIGGSLSTDAATYVDLLRTSVIGDVTLDGSDYGVTVAGAVITGSLSVTNSDGDLLVGATAAGLPDSWGNTIGGNLNLAGNTGNLQVAATNVLGSIELGTNTPAANFGSGVNAGGGVNGSSTGAVPGAGTVGEDGQAVVVVVPDRHPGEFIWTIDSTTNLVNLGVAVESGDHFAADGNLNNIRVTDTRLTQAAWAVNAQLGDFTNGATTSSGKYLGWVPGLAENTVGATAGASVPSGFVSGDGLSVSRELGGSAAGHTTGSVVLGAYLDLKLPVAVGTGTYNATLTLTALS